MAEQEQETSRLPEKRRKRTWLVILSALVLLLLFIFLGIFIGFNNFGERFLRKYLQEKIRIAGNGLYQADFKTMHLNILTGKVTIDSFELIPDTSRYRQLKEQGRITKALYRASMSCLTIDKVRFWQIYSGKRINFRQVTISCPVLKIEGFRDTATARQSRWRVVYEDIYPVVSGFFRDFHVDSVTVDKGRFLSSSHHTTGRSTSGEYEFSAILRDVSVNRFSYYNHSRVFYSRDVDLVVHDVEYMLADSLYVLKAGELGFSLTRSVLYGKKLALLPNFKSRKMQEVASGDLFRLDLPGFSISGIDLYKAMTNHEVEIHAVKLNDFFIRVFRNNPPQGMPITRKSKKKINLAGLYTIVAKELRHVNVDSLSLTNASFEFFAGVTDKRPELKIGKVNLALSHFRLDAVSYRDPDRIFYSRGIELTLNKFSLFLRDGIHTINASVISFSTQKSLIDVHEASIFPNRKRNLLLPAGLRNTMFVYLPRLTFSGIDLKKVFNSRIFDFDSLTISEPEMRFTRLRPSKNPDPRFKKPQDFFEEENEEAVYDLLKKYLWIINGKKILISNGFAQFSTEKNGTEIPVAAGSFNLAMQQFLIDSVHGMNQQGYFYSRDFDLDVKSLSLVSPDSLSHLRADRVHIATRDSLFEAENLQVFRTAGPLQLNVMPGKRQSLAFDFSLKKVQLTGLNHKKLFLEKIVKANQIILENPSVHLKSSGMVQLEGPLQESQLLKTNKFARIFDIGRCLVKKGSFSYDGQEDRKATYLSLKDIDFTLVNALVQIPETGKHNGIIRFDSLQLRVFPLRAVLADSAYLLEARSLEVHSYPADIILKGIKVIPLRPWNETPEIKSQVTVSIPEIRLNGFYFDRAIFDNRWLLETIYADQPAISVEMRQDEARSAGFAPVDPTNLVNVPPFMQTVAVRKIFISGANAGLIIHRPGRSSSYRLNNFMLNLAGLRIDSSTRANPSGTPLFNSDDITLSAPGFAWATSDSMYTFAFSRFGLSTGSASAYLDSLSVTPNYSRNDFSRKLGNQTDRIVLKVPRIMVSGIDFRKLIGLRQLQAARINLDGATFESFRDKRVPCDSVRRTLMPTRIVAAIRFPASIDTIAISNGFASYEEQAGDEPGRIYFDRMNAILTGFTTLTGSSTPSGCIDIHGTSRLMGMAPIDSWFHFQTGHPTDTFTVHATIGELDLARINPMLSKLVPASIKTGTATTTEFVGIYGNNTKAVGRMNLRYHDLTIRLHQAGPGTWNHIEQSLLTGVVNMLLADSNPDDNGRMKSGIIYFERDPSRGFLNFLWKSVLSGIKSSVGVNSKTQKELIKAEKLKVEKKDKE